MIRRRKVRDHELIDALEALPATEYEGQVWRVVRGDRDSLRGSAPGGRWDDGTFDVLYTSLDADGAISEMYFHLMRGQPIFPSKMEFRLHALHVVLRRALRLADMTALDAFGVEGVGYESQDNARRRKDYRRMQEIGEASHFLGFDGLIVPSVRWECQNLVLFSDRVPPEALRVVSEEGPVDWTAWKRGKSE